MIKFNNWAVVSVLQCGRAQGPFWGACAHNIWYVAALDDIHLHYVHVLEKYNRAAVLLSGWASCNDNVIQLNQLQIRFGF